MSVLLMLMFYPVFFKKLNILLMSLPTNCTIYVISESFSIDRFFFFLSYELHSFASLHVWQIFCSMAGIVNVTLLGPRYFSISLNNLELCSRMQLSCLETDPFQACL